MRTFGNIVGSIERKRANEVDRMVLVGDAKVEEDFEEKKSYLRRR